MKTLVLVLATVLGAGDAPDDAGKPLGHWPLQDGAGQAVKESVKAHKAVLGAGKDADEQDPKWVAGRLVFDGKDDCVTVGDGEDFVLTDKGTLAGWVKLDKTFKEEGSVVIKPSNWYFVISTARQPQFIYYNTEVFSGLRMCNYMPGRTHLPTDQWLHVAVTFGGRAIRFYINGKPDSSRLFEDEILVATPRPVRIGCEAEGGRPFKGSLAGVSIYNRTLGAREINQHMKRTDPRTDAERDGADDVQISADTSGDANRSGIQW